MEGAENLQTTPGKYDDLAERAAALAQPKQVEQQAEQTDQPATQEQTTENINISDDAPEFKLATHNEIEQPAVEQKEEVPAPVLDISEPTPATTESATEKSVEKKSSPADKAKEWFKSAEQNTKLAMTASLLSLAEEEKAAPEPTDGKKEVVEKATALTSGAPALESVIGWHENRLPNRIGFGTVIEPPAIKAETPSEVQEKVRDYLIEAKGEESVREIVGRLTSAIEEGRSLSKDEMDVLEILLAGEIMAKPTDYLSNN